MGDTTKPRQIRIADDAWTAYANVCKRLGRTRADDINDHIAKQVRQHGTAEDIELLERAETELAERRARKGGRPRGADPAGESYAHTAAEDLEFADPERADERRAHKAGR